MLTCIQVICDVDLYTGMLWCWPVHRYVVMLTCKQEYLGLDATSSRRQSDNWVLRTTRGNHACQSKRFRTMYTLKQRRKIIFFTLLAKTLVCVLGATYPPALSLAQNKLPVSGRVRLLCSFFKRYNSRKGRECSSDLYPAEDKSSGISNSSSEIPPMISWLTKLDAIKK